MFWEPSNKDHLAYVNKAQHGGAWEGKPQFPGPKRGKPKSAGTLFSDTCRTGCLLFARPSANSASRRKIHKASGKKKRSSIHMHSISVKRTSRAVDGEGTAEGSPPEFFCCLCQWIALRVTQGGAQRWAEQTADKRVVEEVNTCGSP